MKAAVPYSMAKVNGISQTGTKTVRSDSAFCMVMFESGYMLR
ncbi:hypothetical protein HPDFL43_00040310 [Hoeflea phototrophica DFL-43]|uniref:Uncharacterized protein n=1 Tax=Hoeflea phototrophica (strain DSM 17068 / NCIMB 14078 / DFL-43) TaxID=411684 RepID=A0A094Z094_HOEPD|nr:hypothetical protein HPDFL43_00040310 [Hoeflea phototrophica DFL-43]